MSKMIKTALVTGGSQRVGRSICKGLANAGYAVAVHYNSSPKEADELVTQLREDGHTATAVSADLSNSTEVRALLPKARELLGPIGLLVNNASLFQEDSLATLDDELWDKHFNVHVKAPALLTAALAGNIEPAHEGLVINIIDERVWKLTPNFTSYTLSKAALWTATQTMAQALAPKVRVNAIGPGPTLPSWRQTQEEFNRQLDTLLLKRAPLLEEFAETILYFAKMRSITGQMIALDGGQHLGWDTADQRIGD